MNRKLIKRINISIQNHQKFGILTRFSIHWIVTALNKLCLPHFKSTSAPTALLSDHILVPLGHVRAHPLSDCRLTANLIKSYSKSWSIRRLGRRTVIMVGKSTADPMSSNWTGTVTRHLYTAKIGRKEGAGAENGKRELFKSKRRPSRLFVAI